MIDYHRRAAGKGIHQWGKHGRTASSVSSVRSKHIRCCFSNLTSFCLAASRSSITCDSVPASWRRLTCSVLRAGFRSICSTCSQAQASRRCVAAVDPPQRPVAVYRELHGYTFALRPPPAYICRLQTTQITSPRKRYCRRLSRSRVRSSRFASMRCCAASHYIADTIPGVVLPVRRIVAGEFCRIALAVEPFKWQCCLSAHRRPEESQNRGRKAGAGARLLPCPASAARRSRSSARGGLTATR